MADAWLGDLGAASLLPDLGTRFGDIRAGRADQASRGSRPLADQPGRVNFTRSNAFDDRCAAEHRRPGELRVTANVLVTRPFGVRESGGPADPRR
jgi:hypothetical protein